jgi:hypothetical protein
MVLARRPPRRKKNTVTRSKICIQAGASRFFGKTKTPSRHRDWTND